MMSQSYNNKFIKNIFFDYFLPKNKTVKVCIQCTQLENLCNLELV